MPREGSSEEEIEHALGVLASREGGKGGIYRRLAARAGVDFGPSESWLLLRLGERDPTDPRELASALDLFGDELRPHVRRPPKAGVLSSDGDRVGTTPEGRRALDWLVRARQEGLSELLEGWSPEQHEELSRLLARGAGQLESDVILCDVAGEEASNVISDLRDLGIGRRGSSRDGPTTTEISSFAAKAERAVRGRSSDAVVWERLEEQTSESTQLSGSFLAFMVVAVLIAAIGLYLGSAILIVGAMIVGPDFGPSQAFAWGR